MGRRALFATSLVLLAGLLAVLTLAGRGSLRGWRLPGVLDPPTPHEAYADALRTSGLSETALGRDWLAAATVALAGPVAMPAPFREDAWSPSDEPRAVAYRLELRRGQRFVAAVGPCAA